MVKEWLAQKLRAVADRVAPQGEFSAAPQLAVYTKDHHAIAIVIRFRNTSRAPKQVLSAHVVASWNETMTLRSPGSFHIDPYVFRRPPITVQPGEEIYAAMMFGGTEHLKVEMAHEEIDVTLVLKLPFDGEIRSPLHIKSIERIRRGL
jgi:hypothetical protein